MKVVILAGGFGTRLSEETVLKPKPMVEIGNKPILWHIMKLYSHYGHKEFIICLGYKGYMIKEYFADYFLHQSDFTVDLKTNTIQIHNNKSEDWKITLIDTGSNSMTGARIKKIKKYINDELFLLTYGDGVSNVNINETIAFHKEHKKIATLTAVQPDGKFGAIEFIDDTTVQSFLEKPNGDGGWVNGGFFVLEPSVFDYIPDGDNVKWEEEPLEKLSKAKKLVAYKHLGFWRPMDTLRDNRILNELWNQNKAPWKVWN